MNRILFFLAAIFFSVTFFSPAYAQKLSRGYGGVELGMTVEQTKAKLKENSDFGYTGDRDVSLLPGENRTLIETDAVSGHSFGFLERC